MRRGLQIIVKDIAFITIEEDEAKSETYKVSRSGRLIALVRYVESKRVITKAPPASASWAITSILCISVVV